VGQGWYYGRPGPLPASLPPTGPQLRLLPLNGDSQAGTPFSIVAGARPVTRTSKELLMPISRYLEAQAGEGSQPPVLLACFQDSQHFTKRTAQRFTLIAAHSPLVAAFGAGLDEEPVPGVRGAHLEAGDPLAGEWNVIVVGPHYAAALVARDLGDTGPDPERRFDYVVTHDRGLVVAAARSLLQWLTPALTPALVAALNR
jgi:DICT domain-containing protein